jgi:hypothetical protein
LDRFRSSLAANDTANRYFHLAEETARPASTCVALDKPSVAALFPRLDQTFRDKHLHMTQHCLTWTSSRRRHRRHVHQAVIVFALSYRRPNHRAIGAAKQPRSDLSNTNHLMENHHGLHGRTPPCLFNGAIPPNGFMVQMNNTGELGNACYVTRRSGSSTPPTRPRQQGALSAGEPANDPLTIPMAWFTTLRCHHKPPRCAGKSRQQETQGVADGTQVTDETGMTPIPPLNFKLVSSAAAGSVNTAPRNIVQASAFFIMALPLQYRPFRTCLTRWQQNYDRSVTQPRSSF